MSALEREVAELSAGEGALRQQAHALQAHSEQLRSLMSAPGRLPPHVLAAAQAETARMQADHATIASNHAALVPQLVSKKR